MNKPVSMNNTTQLKMTNRKALVTFVTNYLAHEWNGHEPRRVLGKTKKVFLSFRLKMMRRKLLLISYLKKLRILINS